MFPFDASKIPDVLWPLWGEGLGSGAHAWKQDKVDGQWEALCGAQSPVFAIGTRGDLCTDCVRLYEELETAKDALKRVLGDNG